MSEALRRLGLRPAGGNHASLRKLIAHYRIPTDHFDPYWGVRRSGTGRARPLADLLVEGSSYSRGHLKHRLYVEGLKSRRCELCGLGEDWHGRRMSLILDHINGVPTDNRIENLRIVCANCAATLDTHCGRNTNSHRGPRCCRRCGAEFIPNYDRHRYCSRRCGSLHDNRDRGPKPGLRKVPRPPHAQLVKDLESLSFTAVGQKYGVSDNAVRKWMRQYEREPSESAA
jgi:hypothetical protein